MLVQNFPDYFTLLLCADWLITQSLHTQKSWSLSPCHKNTAHVERTAASCELQSLPYRASPAPGIIARFKLDDYKTFQESSRWLHQQCWCTHAVCWFPSKSHAMGSDQSEQKKYIGHSCYRNRKHPYSTSDSSVESLQLLVGFQGIGFPSLLLSGSQKQHRCVFQKFQTDSKNPTYIPCSGTY